MVDASQTDQILDRIEAVDHVVIVYVFQIRTGRHFGLGGAQSGAYFPTPVKTPEVVGKEAAAVENTKLKVGKAVEQAAIGHEAEAEGAIGGIAANQFKAVWVHHLPARDIFRMYNDQHVKFLGFGPKRVEVRSVIVSAVDVGAYIAAVQLELDHRVLQHLGGADRVLQRNRRHPYKAIRITLD